jgi:assimilatory nitrate reductase catalytic subunit
MGFGEQFAYSSAADIFREHAALSSFENEGSRDFDIGALASLSDDAYETLEPLLWPVRVGQAGPEPRFFEHGNFYTGDRRAKFIATAMPALNEAATSAYPFRLNTGRIRDQWHTMTRTGLSPRLGQHLPEAFIELHPQDAVAAGLQEGGFARVSSAHGEAAFRVKLDDGLRRGEAFAPIHWSFVTSSQSRTGNVVAPVTDPFSGQPEAKATPVAIVPTEYAYAGFVLSRASIELPRDSFWSRVAVEGGEGLLFATNTDPETWRAFASQHIGPDAEVVEYSDVKRGLFRIAAIENGTLKFSLFVGPTGGLLTWDTTKAILARHELTMRERGALLSGKSLDGIADSGPIICACFGVGLATIRSAIEGGKVSSVDEIGVHLRAGTNCGSCKPELKRIVQDARVPQAV